MKDSLKNMRLFVSAIEPSANIHLKALAHELNIKAKQRGIYVEIVGIFDKSVFEGCESLQAYSSYELSAFAAMAFIDVIKKYFFYKRVNVEMIALAKTCQKALLIDSSSFHIPLAKGLKGSNTQVLYYILPQVWAWKSWRAKELEQICDRLCGILPFELILYPNAQREGRAMYVGHPLLDELPQYTESKRGDYVVFMPGSRKGEIRKIFPIFAQVAQYIESPKIVVAPAHFSKLTSSELKEIYGEAIKEFEISFEATSVLQICKFAFICSGTATLQAALLGAPFVLGYKMRKLEYYIARAFVGLNVVGLANILYQGLCGERVGKGTKRLHQELIQDDLNVENLLNAYRDFDFTTYKRESHRLRDYLHSGSSQAVAGIILE